MRLENQKLEKILCISICDLRDSDNFLHYFSFCSIDTILYIWKNSTLYK